MRLADTLKYLSPVYWMRQAYEMGVNKVLRDMPQKRLKKGLDNRTAHGHSVALGYPFAIQVLPAAAALCAIGGLAISAYILGASLFVGAVGLGMFLTTGIMTLPYTFGLLDGARDTLLALKATPKTQAIDMTAASLLSQNENAEKFNKESDKAQDPKKETLTPDTTAPRA